MIARKIDQQQNKWYYSFDKNSSKFFSNWIDFVNDDHKEPNI